MYTFIDTCMDKQNMPKQPHIRVLIHTKAYIHITKAYKLYIHAHTYTYAHATY